jgi:hypothetical protein
MGLSPDHRLVSAREREIDEIAQVPETERSEVRHILREHGLAAPLAET